MRLSDHRLSYPMRDLLKGLVVGEVHRNSGNFSFGTAEALRKRGLIDDNLSPTALGRSVATELIHRSPRQYEDSVIDRLIAGLKIFQQYNVDAEPFPMTGSFKLLAIQDESLSSLTAEHRLHLQDCGWSQEGTYYWTFSSR
jgi:hypothetical protein